MVRVGLFRFIRDHHRKGRPKYALLAACCGGVPRPLGGVDFVDDEVLAVLLVCEGGVELVVKLR